VRPFVLLIAGLILLGGVPSLPWPVPSVVVPAAADRAVYVYEKDATPVPTGVTVALDTLNRERKIVATLLEDDTTDGDGDIPDQYRPALEVARAKGLPALVVLSGSTVLSIVQDPKTAEEIARAVP
jgi:hypothetical protein